VASAAPAWIHGASFGEVNGMLPIIRALKAHEPKMPVIVSATSVTGLDTGSKVADETHLLPFDHPLWIRRVLAQFSPRVFVFGETEVWPLLLDELSARRVPCILANGRISDRAFPRYLRWKKFLEPRLKRLTRICVSSEVAFERFLALGANREQLVITGNAKYDLAPALRDTAEIEAFRRQFFLDQRPVVVLGSLRPGEEEEWFPVLKEALSQAGSALGVVVAPRHKEKFSSFAEQLSKHGIAFWRRSESSSPPAGAPSVVLLDSLGELASVYAFADLGFVGGTLRNYGGHNPLEPAAHGAAVALGPYHQNAGEVVERLQTRQALFELSDKQSLREVLSLVVSRSELVQERRRLGHEVWRSFQGATERTVAEILSAAPLAFPSVHERPGRAGT
jgi:3-deoxy-D-manno-octulosonic-acid transferase